MIGRAGPDRKRRPNRAVSVLNELGHIGQGVLDEVGLLSGGTWAAALEIVGGPSWSNPSAVRGAKKRGHHGDDQYAWARGRTRR